MSEPEMKIDADGAKYWLLNGRYHREDGPAVVLPSGYEEWYLNGRFHREDGPAAYHPNGTKYWFLNGNRVSWQQVFKKAKTEEIELRILSYVDDLLT
jgi:hypothetical protein